MEKFNLVSADLLDIVFEYRNKLYGAYDLRRTYPKRIVYAIGGTMLFCLLFIAGSILARNNGDGRIADIVRDIELMDYKEENPLPEPPPPPPPPKQEPPRVEIARFTPPAIVKDAEVKPEDEIKEVEKLAEAKIGTINQDGEIDKGIVVPIIDRPTGIAPAPKVEEDIDKVFTIVQMPAEFEGGMSAWRKFLERNLNRDLPSENGAPVGRYTVTISFTVDQNGNPSEIFAENDPGFGTKDEALRVIKKAPRWTPAEQNGRKVKYRHKQNITFEVSDN